MKHSDYFIQGILKSDEKIVSEIYEHYFPKVLAFVYQNQGHREDAEDIFQKVLLQISVRIKHRELTFLTSTFEAYLFTACKNLWRRELNKRKKRVTNSSPVELVSEEVDMARALFEQERFDFFKEKLSELSGNCKIILDLFLKKVSYEEMVRILSYTSETVVRQRVFKCKAKLIRLIKADKRYRSLK